MQGDLVGKIVSLRENFNQLLASSGVSNSLVFAIGAGYLVYLLGVVIYVLDASAEGKKQQKQHIPLKALVGVNVFNVLIVVCSFVAVFLFPNSAFTTFLSEVLRDYPQYLILGFVVVVIASLTAYLVGLLSNRERVYKRKSF